MLIFLKKIEAKFESNLLYLFFDIYLLFIYYRMVEETSCEKTSKQNENGSSEQNLENPGSKQEDLKPEKMEEEPLNDKKLDEQLNPNTVVKKMNANLAKLYKSHGNYEDKLEAYIFELWFYISPYIEACVENENNKDSNKPKTRAQNNEKRKAEIDADCIVGNFRKEMCLKDQSERTSVNF